MGASIIHTYSSFHQEIARIGQALAADSLHVIVENGWVSEPKRKRRDHQSLEAGERLCWGWTADSGIITSADSAEIDERLEAGKSRCPTVAAAQQQVYVGRVASRASGVRGHVIVSWSDQRAFANELATFAALLVHVSINTGGDDPSLADESLQAALDSYTIPILCTRDCTILFVNRAAAKLLGLNENRETRSICELVSDDDRTAVSSHLGNTSRNLKGGFIELSRFGPKSLPTSMCTVPVSIGGTQVNASVLLVATPSDQEEAGRARDVIEALEQQQRRIGIDLHDGLGQLLTAARIVSYNLAEAVAVHEDELHSQCLRLASLTDEAMTLLRAITTELSPPQLLKEDSFADALESLVDVTHEVGDAYCTFEYEGDIEISDAKRRTHAFRIVQEAVNNALKHSGADYIHVLAKRLPDDNLLLEVSDDGIGFESRPDKHSLGMESMYYRAKALGAELSVRTVPNRHTTVTCRIPVQ